MAAISNKTPQWKFDLDEVIRKKKLRNMEPDEAHHALARALTRMGQPTRAIKRLTRGTFHYPGTMEMSFVKEYPVVALESEGKILDLKLRNSWGSILGAAKEVMVGNDKTNDFLVEYIQEPVVIQKEDTEIIQEIVTLLREQLVLGVGPAWQFRSKPVGTTRQSQSNGPLGAEILPEEIDNPLDDVMLSTSADIFKGLIAHGDRNAMVAIGMSLCLVDHGMPACAWSRQIELKSDEAIGRSTRFALEYEGKLLCINAPGHWNDFPQNQPQWERLSKITQQPNGEMNILPAVELELNNRVVYDNVVAKCAGPVAVLEALLLDENTPHVFRSRQGMRL